MVPLKPLPISLGNHVVMRVCAACECVGVVMRIRAVCKCVWVCSRESKKERERGSERARERERAQFLRI